MRWAIAVALFALAIAAHAATIEVRRDTSLDNTGGNVIAALGLDSNRWTGWIRVQKSEQLVLANTLVDANDSVTAVNMRCETSNDESTANDAGNDVCCRSISGGTATYTCPCSYTVDYTNGGSWSWTVEHLAQRWVNCLYSASGSAAAADTIDVTVEGKTP